MRALWHAAYPERSLPGLVSDQWKEMGWQGADPSTDFRFLIHDHLSYSLTPVGTIESAFFQTKQIILTTNFATCQSWFRHT